MEKNGLREVPPPVQPYLKRRRGGDVGGSAVPTIPITPTKITITAAHEQAHAVTAAVNPAGFEASGVMGASASGSCHDGRSHGARGECIEQAIRQFMKLEASLGHEPNTCQEAKRLGR